ncbi:MAG: hypothetical protein IPN89_10035 [Saprospiraceae bacterium]|nr:hypothetical protein [Saprospiraceae bacterium]
MGHHIEHPKYRDDQVDKGNDEEDDSCNFDEYVFGRNKKIIAYQNGAQTEDEIERFVDKIKLLEIFRTYSVLNICPEMMIMAKTKIKLVVNLKYLSPNSRNEIINLLLSLHFFLQ